MLRRYTGKKAQLRSSRVVPLGRAHSLELQRRSHGAVLRVRSPDPHDALEIEIVVTAGRPTVRVRAPSIELESTDQLAMRCRDFTVEAEDTIQLKAHGKAQLEAGAIAMRAERGGAVVQANDDVQILGEKVLLNCDRQPPMPTWIETSEDPVMLPIESATGDPALLLALAGGDFPLLEGPGPSSTEAPTAASTDERGGA